MLDAPNVVMKNVPNAEQAIVFDKFIKKWQAKLNLNDWRIERYNKVARDAMACISFDDEARLATYQLGSFGEEKITPSSLESTALHEALHVFLHDLRKFSDDEGVEHQVINVLEKLLLEI